MPALIDPELLRGISVYQDLILADGTRLPGQRDCVGRWEAIAPHLPEAGTFLDVGSNFGWFGTMLCRSRPDCVVASVEADERTARVQHRVLRSHQASRICLLTRKAGAAMAERFSRCGQRFDAVLCLSVLHWMADHRRFLAEMGRISGRLLIEQPAPDEKGAGLDRIRAEIGPMDHYLTSLFPQRPVRCLAEWPSHRGGPPRQLWLVAEPSDWEPLSAGLNVNCLLENSPGWPSRSWWLDQVRRLPSAQDEATGVGTPDDRRGGWLTPQGVQCFGPIDAVSVKQLSRRLGRLPQRDAMCLGRRVTSRARRWAAALRQSWLR